VLDLIKLTILGGEPQTQKTEPHAHGLLGPVQLLLCGGLLVSLFGGNGFRLAASYDSVDSGATDAEQLRRLESPSGRERLLLLRLWREGRTCTL
jgi:hypothetical protein